MSSVIQNLRYAVRRLLKNPGFTAVAVITLALGVGANMAVFTIVGEMVFAPRPYPHEKQVFQLYTQDKKRPGDFRLFSYPTYVDIREQSGVKDTFSGLLAHNTTMVSIGQEKTSRRAAAAVISSNYFRMLQVPLVHGRTFLAEEESPSSAVPVVIASYLYWKSTGFDPDLVGKTIRVNERPFTVVGITPEHFTGTMMLFGPELYFPLSDYDVLTNGSQADAKRTLEHRDAYNLFVVGRVKPGISPAAAGAALKTVATNLESAFPVLQKDQTFIIRPLPRTRTSIYPSDERDMTMIGSMMFALAGIVLFVACLNLADMFLARGLARRKEIAIRLALGGGRGRIIRQFLTEGLVLSLAGGAVGLLVGLQSAGLVAASLGAHMPVSMSLPGVDPAAILAALGLCALATLFFALGPALKLTRTSVLTDLKEQAGEDAVSHNRRWLPRNPLVVAQIALSLGLITAAGLFIRGALKAGSVETGFKAYSTVLIEADASLGGYDQARSLQIYRAVGERLAALPGVQAASIASTVPFGLVTINRPVQRAGVKPASDSHPTTAAEGLAFNVRWSSVGADYFTTMGLPLLRGRAFTKSEAEQPGTPPVAIIDDALAEKLWPAGDALGQRIQWAERGTPTAAGGGSGTMGISNDIARNASDPQFVEIVGIVPATRWELFRSEVGGQVFVPFAQGFRSNVFFQVRAASNAAATDPAFLVSLRQEFLSAAPGVPVFSLRTFPQHLDADPQLWAVRSSAVLVSIFAGLASILAIVGVYGVVAYAVIRRTREIGIRMALGADRGGVLWMILRQGLVMALAGAALGFLFALSTARLFEGVLYQVSPLDPFTFTIAPAVILGTALLASYLPARRAARMDPVEALRYE